MAGASPRLETLGFIPFDNCVQAVVRDTCGWGASKAGS